MDVIGYIKKYGNYTFKEKEFNDIDNLVFCNLSYLDFSYTSINISEHTLGYIGREYLKNNKFRDIRKLGIGQRNGYKVLESVINTKRYKNLIVHDYVCTVNKNKQFSACMFRISDELEYICYEGTDEAVSGWKEDFELACFFPVPAQKDAIKYANKHIKIRGPYVIIGGHSKGGNLALVAAMYTNELKQFRIKKVYSNDGPGLRRKEFESGKYRRIKRKFIHIVPEYSVVGILMRNDVYHVIKSTHNNMLSHSLMSWIIKDDKLVKSELSLKSKKLESRIISWLEKHSDEEKEKTINTLFKVLEDADITKLVELNKISNVIKVINNIKNVDKQTKDVFIDLVKNGLFERNVNK